MLVIDSCLGRAMRKQMLPTLGAQLPSQDQIVVTLSRLLGSQNPAQH